MVSVSCSIFDVSDHAKKFLLWLIFPSCNRKIFYFHISNNNEGFYLIHTPFSLAFRCCAGRGGGARLQKCQAKSEGSGRPDPGARKVASSDTTSATATASPASGLKALSQQIEQARLQIQSSLKNAPTSIISGGVAPSDDAEMREENLRLKKQLEDLQNQVRQLTDRVTRLEASVKVTGGAPTPAANNKGSGDAKKKPVEDDDDVDLFGSDEEEDADAAKVREQRLAEYAAKKSKKPALVAKSNVILDVKPWDGRFS